MTNKKKTELNNNLSKPLLLNKNKAKKNLSFNYLVTFLNASKQQRSYRWGYNNLKFSFNLKLKIKNFIDQYSCERRKAKRLDGHFTRMCLINDKKKRTRFDKCELKNILLKALIKSDVNLNKYKQTQTYLSPYNKHSYKLISLRNARPGVGLNARDNSRLPLGPGLTFQIIIVKNICSASFSKVRNRCILTGHSTCLRGFGLSRISFRRYAALGLLPGVIKAINK